jgi:hypothetical protein
MTKIFSLKSFAFISYAMLTISSLAQTVAVSKSTNRIKTEQGDGFEVNLQAAAEEVDASLSKLMKTFGKSKSDNNFISISEPTIRERKYMAPLYATVKQVGNTTTAWIGIIPTEYSSKDADALMPDLEKVAYEFGVNFYREKIQKQIDEAVRASQTVDRQQLRLQNQNKDLNSKLQDNIREKAELEKSLQENQQEKITLEKKLELNKKQQDSVAVAAEQVKKMVEFHREKQRQVH